MGRLNIPNPRIAPLVVTLALLGASKDAHAAQAAAPDTAWTGHGLQVCSAPNAQGAPAMASDGSGGFFVAWEDARSNPDTTDLYVQHLLGDGTIAPGWPYGGEPLCTAIGNQNNPQLCPDGLGGVFAVWEDSRGAAQPRLYAQHVSGAGPMASGWPADGLPVCTSAALQRAPQLVSDGSGGVIVAWEDYRLSEPRVFLERLTASGGFGPGWDSAGIAAAKVPGGQVEPVAATDGAGGVIVAWSDGRGGITTSADIYAQHLLANGMVAAGWPTEGEPVCGAPGAQELPSIAGDGGGGAYVSWMDARSGLSNIYAQHLTTLGTASSGWTTDGVAVCRAFPAEYNPVITGDGAGGALIAWTDTRSINGSGDVYAQRLDSAGIASWSADGVPLCTALKDQLFPSIVSDGAGGAFVAWQDGRYGSQTRPFVQRVTASGTIAGGWPVDGRACADTNVVFGAPVMLSDGAGGVFLTWSGLDLSGIPGPPDLYAARMRGDALVPALASLVSAEAGADRVRVSWLLARGGSSATVERSVDRASWRALATLIADGSGLLRFEDREVTPGATYGYRLSLAEGPAGETWITLPRWSLAISGVTPSPAIGRAEIALSLAEARPARLELFDLAGRRRWERAIDGALLAPRLALETSSFEPGVYLLRLTQGEKAVNARLVVAR